MSTESEGEGDLNKSMSDFQRPRPRPLPEPAAPTQEQPQLPPATQQQPPAPPNVAERMAELEYRVETSIRYNHRRRRFFESVNTALKIVTLASSTAAFATLVDSSPLGPFLMGVVAAVHVLSLAIEPDKKAAEHGRHASAFVNIRRDAELAGEPTAESARLLWARVYEIERDEAPTKKVLTAMAHNDYAKRIGSVDLVSITPWQRRLANFFDFKPHTLNLGG